MKIKSFFDSQIDQHIRIKISMKNVLVSAFLEFPNFEERPSDRKSEYVAKPSNLKQKSSGRTNGPEILL